MEIKVNDRYKVRSDGSLNWMPYRRSAGEDGEERWNHMGTYHATLQDALLSLYRKAAIEDARTMGDVAEAVGALRELEQSLVDAVREAVRDAEGA